MTENPKRNKRRNRSTSKKKEKTLFGLTLNEWAAVAAVISVILQGISLFL